MTRLLGRGGMGAVFAAQHEMLGEEVAIKLMLAEAMREPEAVKKRFVNEARAAAKIRGEHVVRVLDVGVSTTGARTSRWSSWKARTSDSCSRKTVRCP